MPKTVHKIRASECGDALAADGFTPSWPEVTCATCLDKRPTPAPSGAIAPLRVPKGAVYKCVAYCGAEVTCYLCNRCDADCSAKAPNDAAAHKVWTDAWVKTIHAPKKRRR